MLDLYPLISLQYVSKTYGANLLDYNTLVLSNVSLNIHDGEFIIIYGPSGSGKSTLLNLVAGLEFPSAGRILVRQRDMNDFTSEELAEYHRRQVGMVFQNFNLIKSLNVWENIALPLTASGARYKARRDQAIQLLELFNLKGMHNRHPNELSGGQQQRVAIARALINNPYLLLIDEPTGNLDTVAANEVMTIIGNLHSQSSHTIVLVTHNPDYLHYASRVLYVKDGKVVKEERPTQSTVTNTALSPIQFRSVADFGERYG